MNGNPVKSTTEKKLLSATKMWILYFVKYLLHEKVLQEMVIIW